MSELVVLGRLGRAHGIRGEIRVDYYAESPLLLEKPLMIQAGKARPRPVKIASWRFWQEKLIVRIEGVNDRTAAEQLRNQDLLIDEQLLPEVDDDEAYINDLLGLTVFVSGEEKPLGVLEDVMFPADQELWSIRAYAEGEYDPEAPEKASGHEILFPAVPDFVEDIDLDAERITITPPEGLLELYTPSAQEEAPDDADPEGEAGENAASRPRRKSRPRKKDAPARNAE